MAISLKKTDGFKLPTSILSAAVSQGGKEMIAGCMDGVYRVDLQKKRSSKLYEHGNYVSSVTWIEPNVVLSAGYDGSVRWYDVKNQKTFRNLKLHDFWSWDMAVSPNSKLLASVTGQYLAGGYKYEPAPEREPSLKIVETETGAVLHQCEHVPSVQSVAFSPNSQFVAAGNIMGEVRIFDTTSGKRVAKWTTDAFTSWGIIKSHCYLGGVFAMRFSPDGKRLLLAGMGPMRDPMAGNGRQLWQNWDWQAAQPQLINETQKSDAGEGLMEALAVSERHDHFAMGGRLRSGDWNLALFDSDTGSRIAKVKTGYRVTEIIYTANGEGLVVVGTQGQPKPNLLGNLPSFGRVETYQLA